MLISTNWPVLFCCFSSVIYLSGCEFWGPYELMVSFKEDSCELGGGGQGVRVFCFSYHVLPPPVLFVLLCLPTPTLHWVAPVFKIKKLRWKVNHSALSGALTEAAFLWNKFANFVGSRVANRGLRYFPAKSSWPSVDWYRGPSHTGALVNKMAATDAPTTVCTSFKFLFCTKFCEQLFVILCISRVKIWFMAISATVWILCHIVHTLNYLHVPFKNLSYVVPILENIVLKEENS